MLIQPKKSTKIDESLLQRTMIPYVNKDAVYLQEAYVDCEIPPTANNVLRSDTDYVVRGIFSIGGSCYIDDTGHFNAVEFNICYNQLFYIALAHGISQKLLKCVQHLTLDEYYEKQLSHIYITRLESNYKKVINSSNFSGTFRIKKAKKMQQMIIFKTEIEFSDYDDGLAYGEIDVVIT